MATKTLVKKIAEFHEDYESEILEERSKKKDIYLENPKEALFFIFSYSFYQGRRDETSKNFEEKAKKVLEEFLAEDNILMVGKERIIDKNKLKTEYEVLYRKLKERGVNKEGDRLMVISLVNLIQSSEQKNILELLKEKIISKEVSEAYRILDNVWSIGQKIASFILRDVVYIYKLESYLKEPEDYYYLQPVDRWVYKVSREINLIEEYGDYNRKAKEIAKDITDKCFKFDVNPIHYNQGAWYVGTNSLKILLRNFSKEEK